MKEMVGGCCVCSDERGWTENPLVYCDGQGCTVAVHQACYGIVSVPSGPWFCRKCESQDGSQNRVRCELCPSRDGALKRSDGNGWAHVVCALYIPEVRFGNVTTMEPIILTLIPSERFNKTCYICEAEGRGGRASVGACMQCNKAGCRSQFHVTCAQSLGLLCEEAGNYLDNVKYCGYCQHHYSKLKKGGNVKSIPPYKPAPLDADEDKERGNKRKPAKPIPGKDEPKATPSKPIGSKEEPKAPPPKPPAPAKEEPKSVVVKAMPAKDEAKMSTSKEDGKGAGGKEENKFTTCNFTESVVTEGGSVFGEPPPPTAPVPAAAAPAPAPVLSVVKEAVKKEVGASTTAPPGKKAAVVDGNKKRRSVVKSPPTVVLPGATLQPAELDRVVKTEADADIGTGTPILVSVPLGAVTQMSTPPTLFQQLRQSMVAGTTAHAAPAPAVAPPPQPDPASKRRRSVSSEKPVPGVGAGGRSKPRSAPSKRASRSNQSPPPVVKDSPPPSPPSPAPSPPVRAAPAAVAAPKGKKKPRADLKFSGAAHMLGNRLNPSSHMSQKLGESLTAELEAHAACGDRGGGSPLTGPQLHSRVIASVRAAAASPLAGSALAASPLAGPLGLAFGPAGAVVPQSLDQLLERQWEQGSQFLMEQAQHFDIASLLSCLHQLRAENLRLEEHVNSLLQRRDHLLAVNARLAIPLTTTAPAPAPAPAPGGGGNAVANSTSPAAQTQGVRPPYENGLDSVLYPTATANPAPRAAPRNNQSFQAGYPGSQMPGQAHPKHS